VADTEDSVKWKHSTDQKRLGIGMSSMIKGRWSSSRYKGMNNKETERDKVQ
jgi:hypothetical protein